MEWALTYLFYAAIGICVELLMHRATDVEGDSAKLARIGEYATNVRLAILLTLLEGFSALVLAVTLYGITRDQDHELAMLAWSVALLKGFSERSTSRATGDYCGSRTRESGRVSRTSLQRTRCVRFC